MTHSLTLQIHAGLGTQQLSFQQVERLEILTILVCIICILNCFTLLLPNTDPHKLIYPSPIRYPFTLLHFKYTI